MWGYHLCCETPHAQTRHPIAVPSLSMITSGGTGIWTQAPRSSALTPLCQMNIPGSWQPGHSCPSACMARCLLTSCQTISRVSEEPGLEDVAWICCKTHLFYMALPTANRAGPGYTSCPLEPWTCSNWHCPVVPQHQRGGFTAASGEALVP